MPIAMIAPMNDCTLSVVPVSQQHQQHAARGRPGRSAITASARRNDWKFAASSRKITAIDEQQAGAQADERLLERRDLPADCDGDAARRLAGPRDGRADSSARLARAAGRGCSRSG